MEWFTHFLTSSLAIYAVLIPTIFFPVWSTHPPSSYMVVEPKCKFDENWTEVFWYSAQKLLIWFAQKRLYYTMGVLREGSRTLWDDFPALRDIDWPNEAQISSNTYNGTTETAKNKGAGFPRRDCVVHVALFRGTFSPRQHLVVFSQMASSFYCLNSIFWRLEPICIFWEFNQTIVIGFWDIYFPQCALITAWQWSCTILLVYLTIWAQIFVPGNVGTMAPKWWICAQHARVLALRSCQWHRRSLLAIPDLQAFLPAAAWYRASGLLAWHP